MGTRRVVAHFVPAGIAVGDKAIGVPRKTGRKCRNMLLPVRDSSGVPVKSLEFSTIKRCGSSSPLSSRMAYSAIGRVSLCVLEEVEFDVRVQHTMPLTR